MKILVAGYSVRHIVSSAARAGHTVFAADGFCDLDLEDWASGMILLPQDAANEKALQLVLTYLNECKPEAVVLGPGFEGAGIDEIGGAVKVLNNRQERAALVSDKLWLARWLEARGFPFIPTKQLSEGESDSLDVPCISLPAVVKPRKGAGGLGCMLVKDRAGLILDEDMIIQDFIPGQPASVSVIGTGRESRAVAVNEQLIGASWAGAEGFRYSGNITPLEGQSAEMARMAEEIVSELGLVGSNGIDFLLTDVGPIVVEVNARFQGSLDTVELATGLNIFEAHLRSFYGELPREPKHMRTAGRGILFAKGRTIIPEGFGRGGSAAGCGLTDASWIADIPKAKSEINKSDPIVSVIATGCSRDGVLRLLMDRSAKLLSLLTSQKLERPNAYQETIL